MMRVGGSWRPLVAWVDLPLIIRTSDGLYLWCCHCVDKGRKMRREPWRQSEDKHNIRERGKQRKEVIWLYRKLTQHCRFKLDLMPEQVEDKGEGGQQRDLKLYDSLTLAEPESAPGKYRRKWDKRKSRSTWTQGVSSLCTKTKRKRLPKQI